MKKNIFIKNFILLSLLLCSFSISSNATSGKIKGDEIRLRKEATTDSIAIETFNNGEVLDIIEKDGEWYKVNINGYKGYIYQDFVEVAEEASSNTTEKKEENKNDKKEEQSNEVEENTENPKQTEKKEDNSTQKTEENKKDESTNQKEETNKKTTVTLGKTKSTTTQKIYILPNIGACAIGQVKKNEEINIIQVLNGWAYIYTDTLSGWTRYDKVTAENKVSTYNNDNDEDKDEDKNNKTTEDNKTTEPENNNENSTNKTNNENKNTSNDNKNNNTTTTKKGYISESGVNFRTSANTSSDVIKTLDINTEITILEEKEDWYKVKIGNDEGYISKDFVSNSKIKETTSRSGADRAETQKNNENNRNSNKVTGEDIVAYAKKYLGYPYVYAEESPSVGFDCSGLVWYVYKHFGYTVSRSSSALANDGKTISKKSDLKPGDILIFLAYNDYSRVGHVGIYIGNNEFIHANDEKTGVIITSLDYGKYPERFVSGRRIIE